MREKKMQFKTMIENEHYIFQDEQKTSHKQV